MSKNDHQTPALQIIEVFSDDKEQVHQASRFIHALLCELDAENQQDYIFQKIEAVTSELLAMSKIWVFIAKVSDEFVGVITLHECAAVYANGIFGEISELYVLPEFRSEQAGEALIKRGKELAKYKGWKRLEVGSPVELGIPRAFNFYKRIGFECTGQRLKLELD